MIVAALIVVLVSGGVVLALTVLFRCERTRGARFAGAARTRFDHTLEEFGVRTRYLYRQCAGQTLRQSLHYVFHQILTAMLRLIQRAEASVYSIVRHNKNRANRHAEGAPSAHLSALAEHKRTTKLSDAQIRQRRDEALNGG